MIPDKCAEATAHQGQVVIEWSDGTVAFFTFDDSILDTIGEYIETSTGVKANIQT